MNVKVLTAVATAAIVFLGSCDKEQKPTKTFGVKGATLAVKDTDEKAEVTVLGNVAFEVKDLKVDGVDPKTGELTVSPLKGDKGAKLTVTFKANSTNKAIKYTFKVVTKDEAIEAGKRSLEVSIEQAAAPAPAPAKTFGVEKNTLEVEASATTTTVKVTGNVAFEVKDLKVDGEDPKAGELTINPLKGDKAADLTVTFKANEDKAKAKVYTFKVVTEDEGIEAGKREVTVTITQAAKKD